MLAGVLVAGFVEFADQLFKDQPHLAIADGIGVQVDIFEALHHQIKQVGFVEFLDGVVEVEALDDLPHVVAEAGDVIAQVLCQLRRVAEERIEVVTRSVVEGEAGFLAKEIVEIVYFASHVSQGIEDILFGRRQNAVDAAQDGEG